jgi:nitroimidazol reductase NimA-like FMN-containing flavoprotein (pyridoxamine 5'-phosphate oxidase superfamily)
MQTDPSSQRPSSQHAAQQASHFEVPAWDAVELLRSSHVGRLCVLDHGTPIALPVNFKVLGRDADLRIVVRTSPTSLVGRYEGLASIEVDHIDEARERAWSVLARGLLRHAATDPTLPDPQPWVAGDRHRWLVLEVRSISARRFTGSPSTAGFAVEWTLEPVNR